VQKLHLVGFTTDLDGLIFSARKGSKAGGYLIPLDKELLSTIAEAERLRNGDRGKDEGAPGRARPTSRLTPREIQAHLRSGRSIPEVAAEAGVDIEWVERFAVPVVAEQAQMVERARAMTYSKARLGQSTQPLGTSVRWNLVDKGVAISDEAFEQGWSAFQLQDEVWMIRFRYTSRARLQVAEWELDLGANQLASRNRLASELGYVEKGRRPPALPAPPPRVSAAAPVRVVEEVVEELEPEPDERPAPVRRAPRRRAPARRTRRAGVRKKSTTRRAPLKKASTKKSSTKRASAKKAAVKKAAVRKARKATSATKATPKRATRKKATRKAPHRTSPKATRRPPSKGAARKKSATRAAAPARKAPAKATPASARPIAAKKEAARAQRRRPLSTLRPTPPAEPGPELDGLDVPPEPDVEVDVEPVREARRATRREPAGRPRIAASSAKDAAKRTARPRVPRPVRKAAKGAPPASPALSGPLARSLLARRLMARKSAEGDGGKQSQRPLRVR